MNFGLDKQIERLVEVLAASALLANNNKDMRALEKLRDHAFPEEINLDEEDPTCGILFGTE